MVILGNLPSQLCVLDSSATLRSSILSFLFKFPIPFFSQNSPKNSSLLFLRIPGVFFRSPFFLEPQKNSSFLPLVSSPLNHSSAPLFTGQQAWLLQPLSLYSSTMLSPQTISAAATFSTTLLLQSLFLLFHLRPLTAYGTPFPESSSTCQSPTATSKSEVDSL